MRSIAYLWKDFVEKHPKASKWLREGGLFFLFSNLVTVVQYIIYAFLPGVLGLELAGVAWSWPAVPVSLFGIDFTWNAIGYDVLYDSSGNAIIGGGLGYLIAMLSGSFLAQVINFPLQRNITFRSNGNPWYQAMWYFIAWVVITFVVNSVNCAWVAVASQLLPGWLYNRYNIHDGWYLHGGVFLRFQDYFSQWRGKRIRTGEVRASQNPC